MSFELSGALPAALQKQALVEILQCNDYSQKFGLSLTEGQALALVRARVDSLKSTGRVEFGGGVTDKLVRAFCDSPFLTSYNYAQTLEELMDLFYVYKNETLDMLTDDELIALMEKHFNGICQGSTELLGERELARIAENLHLGHAAEYVAPEDRESFDTYDEWN